MMSEFIELDGVKYQLDTMGYLTSMSQWDTKIRDRLAALEHVVLTPDHLKIIEYFRAHFLSHNEHPAGRKIIMALPQILGKEKGTAQFFSLLFPGGFNQAYKLSGLPVRHSCC